MHKSKGGSASRLFYCHRLREHQHRQECLCHMDPAKFARLALRQDGVAQTLMSVLWQSPELQIESYDSAALIHFSTAGGSYSDKRRSNDAGSTSTIAIDRCCARTNPTSTARSRNDSSGA